MKFDPRDFDKTIEEHVEKADPTHPMRLLARQFIRERGVMRISDIEDLLFDFGRVVEKQ
jgi:hypothetical protein